VDTDGADLAVLLGARKLLSNLGPIALAVETHFVGSTSPYSNLFSNVDTYLQGLGYSLFGIEPRLHARAALPRPFRWFQPADTHAGQSRWADTLFFRDVCIPGYEVHFGVTLTAHKLLKLCCAFELFSLEDCAAEVLVNFRERIQAVTDVDLCLNLLTPPLPDGRTVSYCEYMDYFESNVEGFYSGTGSPAHHVLDQQIADLQLQVALRDAETEKLRSLQASTETELLRMKAELECSERECAKLRHMIESSLALKLARSAPFLLEPVRALIRRRSPSPAIKE
jgi:hypothetical protein